MKKPLIVLTGPTAAGKTHLSISLAKAVNGEIISTDSMQVYKYMDIGSAKIMLTSDLTPEELIQNISTKGGCTAVGVDYMMRQKAGEMLQETIRKTTEKAHALGK